LKIGVDQKPIRKGDILTFIKDGNKKTLNY